jgi:hypothetical protein
MRARCATCLKQLARAGFVLFGLFALRAGTLSAQTNAQVLSWNNLGMHCMDDDFSIFAILPPYNTIEAQVVTGTNGTARRVAGTGSLQVNYRAVLDADGSINTTSIGKGNFWTYVFPMLGAPLAPDQGLELIGSSPGAWMPGPANTPKPMYYEAASAWFVAWGIPITPFDDDYQLNPYPMMHVATSGGGIPAASTDIVLPVSTEMDCRLCHASGSGIAARPAPDWEWNPVPTRDYRFNILRLHDQKRIQAMPGAYSNYLADAGFNTQGLYASVVKSGRPVLCALCHTSEAVPESGQPGIPQLTTSIHGFHATVNDPKTGVSLGATDSRSSCYRCHPGAETRCLRGAMGRAVAADGSLAIQCQDCHGSMSTVGSPARTGWFEEPNCQACHSGDAVSNSGKIRYDNVYVSNTVMRAPANRRFATNTNAPLPGLSLFRFSKGHGGLYCSACHGSTHAEFPSAFFNDNVANMQRQGHVGQMSECSSCHGSNPTTVTGGPHGMHRLAWTGGGTTGHRDYGQSPANCQVCHGTTYRGTVLSRSFKNQSLSGRQGSQTFWRGRRIGCYDCHNGVGSGTGSNPPAAPTATSRTAATTVNQPVPITLTASTALLRIVSQPERGMVGISNNIATYYPAAGYVGSETFTFCSDSGFRESNLATVTVTVSEGGPCSYTLSTNLEFFDELSHVGEVQVTTGAGCAWTAASQTHWLTLLSSGGPGSGLVRYAVERNTNSYDRMGSLSIAGKTVYVFQDGTAPDTNGDGLTDSWQMLYFMSANSPLAAPALDPDGDGMNNRDEYLAGTDPTDPDSALRITAFDLARADQAFQLTFPSILQHYYQVQRTADLLTPDWKGYTNAVYGTGEPLPLSGPASTNAPRMFYRVLLVQ